MELKEVILVDEEDQPLGVMEKMEAHRQGLLHRAFSVFILNERGEMLLQKRALQKYHSPGLWTNACCSHPSPGELTLTAAVRRLDEEMGFKCALTEIGAFTYETKFENGLVEHEFDHVLLGLYGGEIYPNRSEVDEYKWITISDIERDIMANKDAYTSWFHLAYPVVKSWLGKSA